MPMLPTSNYTIRHVGCTESFYKSQVEESMQAQKADDQAKEQMQSILQEFHEQTRQDSLDIGRVVADESDDSDSESDEESELAKRLDGIDLESSSDQTMDAIWSRLTNSEREAFLKMIESRDIADILETWTPWWTNASENSKIAELDGSGHQTLNSNNGSVPTVKNIGVPIQTLTKKVADVYSSAYEATVVALASIDPEMSHEAWEFMKTDALVIRKRFDSEAQVFAKGSNIIEIE
ncbi:Zinc finger HIT domain-containing protein 2 [Coemansia sp. Benny D115]|nr:Zinc finger HIT domain-containing protein 2 [Coemansia sp. Benny D115]